MNAKPDELGALVMMLVLLAVASALMRGQPAMRWPQFAPPSEPSVDIFTRELGCACRRTGSTS